MPIKPQVEIARAVAEDIPRLACLAAEFYGDEQWLRERITETWPNWIVFVAKNGTEIVGLVAAIRENDLAGKPVFNLLHLYVQPRARHIEVARRLVESISALGETIWTAIPAEGSLERLAHRFGFRKIGVVMAR